MPLPAPQDLPGFYYDREKNRYFPIKDPIPGGGSKHPPPPQHPLGSRGPSKPKGRHIADTNLRKRAQAVDLLQVRELQGRVITSNKSRHNFELEFQKIQVSHPKVWKYQSTDLVADSALEQFNHVTIQTPEGHAETNLLSVGSKSGSISVYEVGKVGRQLGYGFMFIPVPVWPLSTEHKARCNIMPGSIWSLAEASPTFLSSISSIQRIGKHSPDPSDHCPSFQNALVTTLGSAALGGSVYVLNLSEPLDFSTTIPIHERTSKIASLDCTIWTAVCNSSCTQAAVGTNLGAALINLETGRLSWLYHTKSDIFSQQFDQSGNIVLCGLRNGSIVTVDVRQKRSGSLELYPRPPRHDKKLSKRRCESSGISSRSSVFMSSAVCSLVSLQTDEQYFLGSSMDGSIQLFDHRLLQRGAVQSYEGHVNSHTHLQLGVDPSETLLMSGGEDCCLRIWSVKSGELIFGERVSNSVVKAVCWPRNIDNLYGFREPLECRRCNDESTYDVNHSWGAWMGSRDGLFYMHGS